MVHDEAHPHPPGPPAAKTLGREIRLPGRDFRRVCPNCTAPLHDRSCKSRCPRCGFFTDCSDPW